MHITVQDMKKTKFWETENRNKCALIADWPSSYHSMLNIGQSIR
jgi:hypothetical protein